MQLSPDAKQVRSQYVARFPVPSIAGGEDGVAFEDRVRQWTRRMAEQLAFALPGHGYGLKARPGGGPISKDGLARSMGGTSPIYPGRPYTILWDILISTGSGHPTLSENPDSVDVSDQDFVPVTPTDHLGAGTPTPVPAPTPTPTPTPVPPTDPSPALLREALMAINSLGAVLGQTFDKVDAMEDRIEELLTRSSDVKLQLGAIEAKQDRPLDGTTRAFGGSITLTPRKS